MSHLLLPRLKIQTANAYACQFVVNASPVMAITQFAHNLVSRHLECDVMGVAIRHHHAEHQALEDVDSSVLPNQRRSASLIDKQDYVGKGSRGPTLSAQPTANYNLEVSVLIEYEGLPDEPKLTTFLRTARLAGGTVIDFQEPVIVDTAQQALDHLGNSGFWLIERPDLIHQEDPLGSAFEAMERQPISEKQAADTKAQAADDRPLHEITHAWIAPTVLGYLAISEFTEREGTRLQQAPDNSTLNTTLHAYAEPLVGMIQYVPARQWPSQDEIPYWRQHWLDNDTFIVQCHLEPDR